MNPLAQLNGSRTGVIDPWDHFDPAACPPSPVRNIAVTDEVREQDAADRAAREAAGRGRITWTRPAPLPPTAYRAPSSHRKATPQPLKERRAAVSGRPAVPRACDWCGELHAFYAMRAHRRTCAQRPPHASHPNTKIYSCPWCGAEAAGYRALDAHKRTCDRRPATNAAKVKLRPCPHCDEHFGFKALVKHRPICPHKPARGTNNIRLRPCELCGEQFGSKALHEHRPRCPKKPIRGASHVKLRPCEHCGEQFGFVALKRHTPRCWRRPAPSKSNVKTVSCEFCGEQMGTAALHRHRPRCEARPSSPRRRRQPELATPPISVEEQALLELWRSLSTDDKWAVLDAAMKEGR